MSKEKPIRKRKKSSRPLVSDQSVIERILDKVEQLDDHLYSIDTTLGKQSVILEEHVKRTNLLEEALKPIQTHVGNVKGAIWFLGGLGIVTGLAVSILKLFL